MKRLGILAAFGLLGWAAACSSSNDGGTPSTGDVDASAPAADGGGGGGGGDAGPGADSSAPAYAGGDVTVSLAAGDGGTDDAGVVSGNVTIHMVPTTPAAIAKIEALVDGKVVGEATASPYDVAWDSASVSNGAHSITARPHDLAGATGSSAALSIKTSNFLLAGTWQWSSITDATPGFGSDSCSDNTFTVTFDKATSTMTIPMFYLSCKAQNNAPYSSKIDGFSQVVAPADYGGPITNTTGTVTTTFSTTSFMQTNSFNNDTQSGKLTKMP